MYTGQWPRTRHSVKTTVCPNRTHTCHTVPHRCMCSQYFQSEITEKKDVRHLEELVSPMLFDAIASDRDDDAGNFRIVRGTMDTSIEYERVEPYLIGFQIDSEDDSQAMREGRTPEHVSLREQRENFGLEGSRVLTAGIRFLTEQRYGWEEGGPLRYRNDMLTFGAQFSTSGGLGQVKILGLE